MSECNKCFRCNYLDRYYVIGDKRFNKTKYGWCYKKREIVQTQDECEMFKKKINYKGVSKHIRNCLSDMLNEISGIRYVLEERCGKDEDGEV